MTTFQFAILILAIMVGTFLLLIGAGYVAWTAFWDLTDSWRDWLDKLRFWRRR